MGIDEKLKQKVIEVLKEIYDPEIPVNIYDLGLIYSIDMEENGVLKIVMTMTTPLCPVATSIVGMIEEELRDRLKDEVKDVVVELTFDPPWHPSMVSKEGREQLKMIYGYDIIEEMIRKAESSNNTT